MKKITLILLFFAAINIVKAQTVLKPGDVAIVHINKAYESFDFVPLVAITTGTVIEFTDMKYSAALRRFVPFANPQYDGKHTFTATQNYAAGTVIQSKGNLLESKKFITSNTEGNTLIAFQVNNNDTTYLTAIGWYTAINFKPGVSDIPPGLSVANNTVVKFDSTATYFNKNLFATIKYDPMGDATKMSGTPGKLRRYFADNANYINTNQVMQNTPVANFNVLQPDVTPPALMSSYPTNNKLNTSTHGIGFLKLNEPVLVQKSLILRNISTNEIIKTYTTVDVEIEKDSTVKFNLYPYLEKSASYSLTIPKDYLNDYDGNTWPSESMTYNFATSANKSTIECCFPDESGIIINPYYSECTVKDDFKWTTISRSTNEYNMHYCNGYFSWTMSGLPMKYYMIALVNSNIDIPDFPNNGIWSTNDGRRLVVDLSGITHNITDVVSHVYDNASAFFQKAYSGPNIVSKKLFSGYTGDRTGYLHFENENTFKLDSLVYEGFEGRLISFKMDIIDKFPPTVELGNAKTTCEGDSVQLDAGLTLGALYDWNTGAKTQKIWAKTSGTYSVTVKNSLGQASDNVLVTVKPVITLSMPDTITACVGDTVTLTAGTNTENSYFWSPGGQTTPSIKVAKSGIYHVLVNNGFGGCFNSDSTRVIFKGAKLHAFHYQGGSYGPGDVVAELYRKNSEGKFNLYREADMLQMVQFDSLARGEYILKSRFVNYSFVGENPWLDTYHDGKTEWKKVTPFNLTCTTDTMIGFMIARKPDFEFNGTGVITGKIQIIVAPARSLLFRLKSARNIDCDTRIVLYNATGDIIATTCPDAQGNYSFANLPAGNYSVGVERTGFEVESVFTTTVAEGQTISNADFTVNEDGLTIQQGITTRISSMGSGVRSLSVFPNPAKTYSNLEFELKQTGTVGIIITDLSGRVVKMQNYDLLAGRNKVQLDIQQLSGLYLVKIATIAGTEITRLIVQ